jgi:acyl carrier protein
MGVDMEKVCSALSRAFIIGNKMQYFEEVRNILADVLGLGDRKASLNPESALMGGIPELDSMAVVNVLTALEEYFGISVDDDEISAATFASVGSLVRFVEEKLAV